MAFYRKKPVVIEARELTAANLEEIELWCKGSIKGLALPREERAVDIQTLEGEMRAEIGCFVIKGVAGEFYPCRADIFKATYYEDVNYGVLKDKQDAS